MGEPRFIADAMLGRLARYLRFLGCDTAYDPDLDDAGLAARSATEGRVLLTRDARLARRSEPAHALLVEGEDVLAQIRQVAEALALERRAPTLERCALCNSLLEPAGDDLVLRRVPTAVLRQRHKFARCPSCDRLYWDGSHMKRLRERLRRALG
jgi:hypothetical protein